MPISSSRSDAKTPPGAPSRLRRAARRRGLGLAILVVTGALALGACGGSSDQSGAGGQSADKTLTISAIPDQDPQELQRLYPVVADYLSKQLGVKVVYKPVTDYAGAVTGFKTGDLQVVWFGGLTALQAMNQVPGAKALAQRDIDPNFHSVFIANRRSGLKPITKASGLSELKGHTFTFGSQSSTSGRLMPEFFLEQAGLQPSSFKSTPGFSGSHDATISLVESGSFDAGALNEQVWKERQGEKKVDNSKVALIWRTPAYHDYEWVARPDLDSKLGGGFTDKMRKALLALDPGQPQQAKILDLFGAKRFIPVDPGGYDQLRRVAKKLDLLNKAGA